MNRLFVNEIKKQGKEKVPELTDERSALLKRWSSALI